MTSMAPFWTEASLSFKSGHTRSASINQELLSTGHIIHGVPLGSVFGPQCFPQCTVLNYLTWSQPVGCRHIRMLMTLMFTLVFVVCVTDASSSSLAFQQFTVCVQCVEVWMGSNRPKLNTEKRQVILIGSHWHHRTKVGFNINFSVCISNLGITDDNQLTIADQLESSLHYSKLSQNYLPMMMGKTEQWWSGRSTTTRDIVLDLL